VAELNQNTGGPGRGPGRGPRGGGGGGGGRGARRTRPPGEGSDSSNQDGGAGQSELVEKVVFINRSAKVVKGGRRFSFSALVVAGDRRGRVGIGLGKGGEVADAIRKGGEIAKQSMIAVSLREATVPHEVTAAYDGACVL